MEKSYRKVIQNQKDELENQVPDSQEQTPDELEQEIDRDIRVDFITRVANNARD